MKYKNKVIKSLIPMIASCLTIGSLGITIPSLHLKKDIQKENQKYCIAKQINDENTLGKQPSFVIDGGWKHSQINNYIVEPMPRSQPLGGLITKNDINVDKDSFLFQMDELRQNAWSKDQWYSLREAILNPSQQLISNIKIGFGQHDDKTKTLSWGQIGVTTHYAFNPNAKITQNIYAINDNQWDKNNGRWYDSKDPLIGSSFTWDSRDLQYDNGSGFTAIGKFSFTINILDTNMKPISLYDCVQVKQNNDLSYSLRFIKDVNSNLSVHFAFNDSFWINPDDKTSNCYVDGNAVDHGKINDLLLASIIQDVPNAGCVMVAQITLSDEEKNYFKSNPTDTSQTISLDENHFKLQKFDGMYITDATDGKDAVLNYFRQYKASIDNKYTFLMDTHGFPLPVAWPDSLKMPSLKLTTSPQNPPALTFFNFSDGYKENFIVNSSIVLNVNFVIAFSYSI